MAKRSTIRGNWPKYLLQWGSLAALIFFFSGLYTLLFPKAEPADPERYCPFGGLEALGHPRAVRAGVRIGHGGARGDKGGPDSLRADDGAGEGEVLLAGRGDV